MQQAAGADTIVSHMQSLEGIEGLRALPPGGVISVGNFDGIHLGHRKLLSLALTLVLATIVQNKPIAGGPGVYLSAVAVPALAKALREWNGKGGHASAFARFDARLGALCARLDGTDPQRATCEAVRRGDKATT